MLTAPRTAPRSAVPAIVRTSNPTERLIVAQLEEDGWEVMKRGWPDFLAIKDGRVRFIEVKPPKSRKRTRRDLVSAQRRMAEVLLDTFGVEVEVVRETSDLKS